MECVYDLLTFTFFFFFVTPTTAHRFTFIFKVTRIYGYIVITSKLKIYFTFGFLFTLSIHSAKTRKISRLIGINTRHFEVWFWRVSPDSPTNLQDSTISFTQLKNLYNKIKNKMLLLVLILRRGNSSSDEI